MTVIRLAILVGLGLSAGAAQAAEPAICRTWAAQADYPTIVVVPTASKAAIVEEQKYQHLPPSLALSITDSLPGMLSRTKVLQKVTAGEACPSEAPPGTALLETSIVSLSHYSGAFHLTLRYRLLRCPEGEVLSGEETFHCRQEGIGTLPARIASRLADTIKLKTACRD